MGVGTEPLSKHSHPRTSAAARRSASTRALAAWAVSKSFRSDVACIVSVSCCDVTSVSCDDSTWLVRACAKRGHARDGRVTDVAKRVMKQLILIVRCPSDSARQRQRLEHPLDISRCGRKGFSLWIFEVSAFHIRVR